MGSGGRGRCGEGESRLVSIGEFAAMTHLSVKMLRRYHDNGLLEPARVDQWSGYRYYEPSQIPVAQTIRRLRELDMPVREITSLLSDADQVHRHQLLTRHLERLEERLRQTGEAVAALRRLLDRETHVQTLAVERRTTPALAVLAITEMVDLAQVLNWYGLAMAEIDATLTDAGLVVSGPAGALYDDALFTEERGRLTVYLPVRTAARLDGGFRPESRVTDVVIAAAELAVTVHQGSHADIDVTYGQLAQWVLDHGLAMAGPVHETYLVGPRDTTDSDRWRTEIAWPIQPA